MIKPRCLLLLILLLPAALFPQSPTILNLSHDLVAMGIANQNLTPNSPTLDARPLLEAAVAYAQKNSIPTVIADPGSYYFLSQRNANTHALLTAASNLTIDFQYSDLYFKSSNVTALQCNACASLTLENFTVDYLTLPFTQVTVTSVDPVAHNIAFQTIAGYQLPSDFNTNRSPTADDMIEMFAFRDGVPIPQLGRLPADRPVNGSVLHITNNTSPWTANLAALQPGDTIVFTDRGGPPAINFNGGDKLTVRNVSLYSAGALALYFGRASNSTADHIQVIPRPGSTRLISSNADGIHFSFVGANNTISNSIVRRTCDDALAMAATWTGTVNQAVKASATVVVSRSGVSPFPVGASVSFINNLTDEVVDTAMIVSETPPPNQQKVTDGELLTLTLDHAVSALSAGFGAFDPNPAVRGDGSVISGNLVQEGVFARGIWFSGVTNVRATDNLIQNTSAPGIYVQQIGGTGTTVTAPSSGVTIANNIVDGAMTYGGQSGGPTVEGASILIDSVTQSDNLSTITPHTNIAITDNRVTNAPRTAIRMQNVNGGNIGSNAIQGYGLAPANNLWSIPPCAGCETMAQWLSDFMTPVVTPSGSTAAIVVANTSTTTPPLATVSNASASPRLAPGSIASAYGQNLAGATPAFADSSPLPTSLGGVTVAVKDSNNVTRNAGIFYVSAGQVNYLVPDGTSPGNATVTINSATGGMQIAPVAPGILSANPGGKGVALAFAALYGADGTVTPVTAFQCGGAGCTSTPMSLGTATDRLIITLYGSGLRGLSSLANATAQIGGISSPILFIGAQPQFTGLDQVNLQVPRALAGRGEVPVVLTLDGQTANVVTVNVQ